MTDLYDAMGTQLAERARCLAAEHGPFASPHEAYGVLAEEVAELLDEVRRRAHNGVRLRDEALDIAAAALRYAVQLEAAWEARGKHPWSVPVGDDVTITYVYRAGEPPSVETKPEPMARPSEESATDDGPRCLSCAEPLPTGLPCRRCQPVCGLCDGTGELLPGSGRCWRCGGTGDGKS